MPQGNLSSQIDFSDILEELGQTVTLAGNVEKLAILNFRDTISATGRQYQYLELEFAADVDLDQGDAVIVLGETWIVSQELRQTYTGSHKFTATSVRG